MAGLGFLIIISILIGILISLIKRTKSWLVRIVITSVYIILIFGDEWYGRYKFEKICQNAGTEIYHSIPNVDGFEIRNISLSSKTLLQYGYSYLEENSYIYGSEKKRLSLKNSEIFEEKIPVFKSKYLYEAQEIEDKKIYGRYIYYVYTFKNKDNNEILSARKFIWYGGGWLRNLIAGLVADRGSFGTCKGNSFLENKDFITSTLQPINKEIEK